MAYYPKVTITCERCGKQHEYSTSKRNEKDAEWWKSWAEGHYKLCPDCEYEAYKERKENERNERVKAFLGKYTLPELKGTPKQIAWAERIRIERIDQSAKIACQVGMLASKAYGRWLETADSAKMWIEIRDLSEDDFKREVARQIADSKSK